MSDVDPLVTALEAVLVDPSARPSTRVQAAAELRAIRESAPVPDPEVLPVLSKAERELVIGALCWHGFEEGWTPEQRVLCLRLGLITQAELDEADAAMENTLCRDRTPSRQRPAAPPARRRSGAKRARAR